MSLMTRRQVVTGLSAAAAGMLLPRWALAAQRPPSILFILADDLGYGDLSLFGRPDYRTPHIDRLGAQGVRFLHAYSAAAMCTPTRVAFHTGRYPGRVPVGLEEPLGWPPQAAGLRPDHPTIGSLLKARGYETSLVGKWHVGYLAEHSPLRHGYDEFFGILSGGADYFTHRDGSGKHDLYEGLVPVERIGYMTDLLTDRAVDFLSRRRSAPFYLSLHYTAPHWPWEGPHDEEVSRTIRTLTEGGSPKIFAGMMRSLDDGVGRVMEALRRAGRDRDTLVVFTSDNGGERYSYNWPLAEGKFSLREGGIRVPAILRWAGTVPAGRVTDQAAITMDWTATLLAAAGAAPDPAYPLDGVDLLPVALGRRPVFERSLFWRTAPRHGGGAAARRGRWKWLRSGQTEILNDVVENPGERANLAARHPEVAASLRAEHGAWNAAMLPFPAPPAPVAPAPPVRGPG